MEHAAPISVGTKKGDGNITLALKSRAGDKDILLVGLFIPYEDESSYERRQIHYKLESFTAMPAEGVTEADFDSLFEGQGLPKAAKPLTEREKELTRMLSLAKEELKTTKGTQLDKGKAERVVKGVFKVNGIKGIDTEAVTDRLLYCYGKIVNEGKEKRKLVPILNLRYNTIYYYGVVLNESGAYYRRKKTASKIVC